MEKSRCEGVCKRKVRERPGMEESRSKDRLGSVKARGSEYGGVTKEVDERIVWPF